MKIAFTPTRDRTDTVARVEPSSNTKRNRFLLSALSLALLLMEIGVAHGENRIQREGGFNGPVHSISGPDSNGTRYVGGDFTAYGRWLSGGGAVVDATDSGSVNPTFPRVNGAIYTSAPDGSGGFFIGGTFDSVDGVPRNNAAHIEADGTLGSWAPEPNGSVRAMVVHESKVYMGGWFHILGERPSIVRRRGKHRRLCG